MRATTFAAVAASFALFACASPDAGLAPTDSPLFDVASVSETLGALETGEHNSASVARGFLCGTGPGGLTTDSHETLSNSGNQTLTCRGFTNNPPPEAVILRGFGCSFFFGGFTFDRTRLVIAPSGEVTLKCQR